MKKFLTVLFLIQGIMLFGQTTFTGTGNWSDAGNWSAGVPTSASTAIIDGTLTVDGDAECTDLTINASAVVSVNPGNLLTVSGTLTNKAGVSGLILQSDATGTGMLLNNTEGVQATVEQYIVKDKWHYMGIPVYTQTGVDPNNYYYNDPYSGYIEDVNSVLHNCYVAWSQEAEAEYGTVSGWHYLSSGDAMHVLQGYAVQYNLSSSDNDTTVAFTGTLNTGTISVNWSSEYYGYNLIANPYPVTMDWDAAGGKTLTNTNDAFYVWNPDLNSGTGAYGSYGSYVSGGSTNGQTQYIAPMQGFFIRVWNVSSAVSFNNGCKTVNGPASFQKVNTANLQETQIKLAVTDNDINYDEMLLRIKDGSTKGFDRSMDAGKMKAMESKQPLLYSEIDSEEYSINSIPEISEDTKIQLKIVVKTDGEQKLVLKDLENYNYPYSIMLFDENGNELSSLDRAGYSFSGKAGEVKSFYLGFKISKIVE